MTIAGEALDLTACDREPIHELGAIQPFGFLIAVDDHWSIARVSSNLTEVVGRPCEELLGRPLLEVFTRSAVHALRNRLFGSAPGLVERVFGIDLLLERPATMFDCAIHRSGCSIVIEAEPSSLAEPTEAAGLIRSMMQRVSPFDDLAEFLQQGARQVHLLTGFDRVMVYRFHEDGTGEVMAEVVRGGHASLLGLHYPASDIPKQARALYLRTPFRIIDDVHATPAAILPALDAAGRPLDLSSSILRAVSPVHMAYLRNMGVAASLSVSIIVDGRLWGLFACHHYTPRRPTFELRTLTELFGQIFSMRLENRERQAAVDWQLRARAMGDRLISAVANDVGLLNDAHWLMTTVRELLPCDGVGISLKGNVVCSGVAPGAEQIPSIVRELRAIAPGAVFATDHLAAVMPAAWLAPMAPAGLLAIPISAEPNDYVMLFRQERIHSVTWAGDPRKPLHGDADTGQLSPRTSFEAWHEEVRFRAEPFNEAELSVAETLRVSLIEIVMRLAGAAAAERQRAMQRQEVLIAELNHRVRNILTVIHGLVRQSSASATEIGEYTSLMEGRVLSLARAHDQITRDNWGPAHIRQLFEAEAAQEIGEARLTLGAAPVTLEPQAFSTLSLVVHELKTNSTKYGALSRRGRVEVDWIVDDDGQLVVSWAEHDGPPVQGQRRPGLGSIIIEQTIPHDLGGQAEVDYAPDGVRARFVIPARYVRFADAAHGDAEPFEAAPLAMDIPALAALDGSVLVVEDSLLIAIHVEEILTQYGARQIKTASNVAEALAQIEHMPPALAVLDFNLGEENSLAIADRLKANAIPFMFATGYGDLLTLPEALSGVPILQKPYTSGKFLQTISGLLRPAPKVAA